MYRSRALAVLVPSLLAAVLGSGAPAASAAGSGDGGPVPHCLNPEGDDLNALYHVKQRIIGPPACRETFEKAQWVRSAPDWVTAADGASAVYPEGYEPLRIDPIDDFDHKFVSATYVHDIGTPQEKSFTYKRKQVLRTGSVGPDGLPFTALISPPFKALSVGEHTTTVFITLDAEHCDGLGTVREENCLPAGSSVFSDTSFEVVSRPRHDGDHDPDKS
ncbi:hypothetical protein ABZY44_20580 [Streptomyces sp. NPDC006544]|uniref:hypothetical protein n=1 Tax=Streptomyces sp. NPDC006544 TaxID=3154583 RepID=UPI0033BAD0C7